MEQSTVTPDKEETSNRVTRPENPVSISGESPCQRILTDTAQWEDRQRRFIAEKR